MNDDINLPPRPKIPPLPSVSGVNQGTVEVLYMDYKSRMDNLLYHREQALEHGHHFQADWYQKEIVIFNNIHQTHAAYLDLLLKVQKPKRPVIVAEPPRSMLEK